MSHHQSPQQQHQQQHFSLLSQQSLSRYAPTTHTKPLFSPTHDLLLIPTTGGGSTNAASSATNNNYNNNDTNSGGTKNAPFSHKVPTSIDGSTTTATNHNVTICHLQKPLFMEPLTGPFCFRPDGLLFNSGSEGVFLDHERVKSRGAVAEKCLWMDLHLLDKVPLMSDSSHNEKASLHTPPTAALKQSRIDSISSTSLLGPLYVLDQESTQQNASSSSAAAQSSQAQQQQQQKQQQQTEENRLQSSPHQIDNSMNLLVPRTNLPNVMIVFNDQFITWKMFGWIKFASFKVHANDMFDKMEMIAGSGWIASGAQESLKNALPCTQVSVAQYGEYGMQIRNLQLPILDLNQRYTSSSTSNPSSQRPLSLAYLNKITRHLANLQYLLLDKLPKALEFMESAWDSFYTNQFQKNLVDTYSLLCGNTVLGGQKRTASKFFLRSFLYILLNGECDHWIQHKQWLAEHASEKKLTKIIRNLNSIKRQIVSYNVHFIQPYIQHVVHHLTSLRANALHQQLVHNNLLFSTDICSTLIEHAKNFYSQTHVFMTRFSNFHTEMLNLLSHLAVHQAKFLSNTEQQKQASIPTIVNPNTIDLHRLIEFLYTLLNDGRSFEQVLSKKEQDQRLKQKRSMQDSSPGQSTVQSRHRKSTSSLPEAKQQLFYDPFRSFFHNVEGEFTKIHQELIVKLSTLNDEFATNISKKIHTSQPLMIPVYDPSNVVGFVHEGTVFWAFMSSDKFVCIRLDVGGSVDRVCILKPNEGESVVQFHFYKMQDGQMVFIFLTSFGEEGQQESFLRQCNLSEQHFQACSLSSLTQAVEAAQGTLPFERSRRCEAGAISEICVGKRGLCAAFGKQQFWIYDLENDEEEDEEESEDEEEA